MDNTINCRNASDEQAYVDEVVFLHWRISYLIRRKVVRHGEHNPHILVGFWRVRDKAELGAIGEGGKAAMVRA